MPLEVPGVVVQRTLDHADQRYGHVRRTDRNGDVAAAEKHRQQQPHRRE